MEKKDIRRELVLIFVLEILSYFRVKTVVAVSIRKVNAK